MARTRGQAVDVALTLDALGRLGRVDGIRMSSELVAERDSIMDRLGVEAVAEVPLTQIRG